MLVVATFCGKSRRRGGGLEDTVGGVAATGGHLLAEEFDSPLLPSLGQELVDWENSGVVSGEIEVFVCLGDVSVDVGCVRGVVVLQVTSKIVETMEEGLLAMAAGSRDWHCVGCIPVEDSAGKVPTAFSGLQVAKEDD